jgi:ABC-type proline/glycine betaine transport system ATPase subunit
MEISCDQHDFPECQRIDDREAMIRKGDVILGGESP